jgi:hypothetical protein
MAEKPVGETVGLKPLPGKALRDAVAILNESLIYLVKWIIHQ